MTASTVGSGADAAEPISERRRIVGSLVPLDQAIAELVARLRPLEPCTLPIEEALGRILAEPIRSYASLPAVSTALRSGWAVSADDTVGASSYSPVQVARKPTWVEGGQPLPDGTDAVLPFDAVVNEAGFSEIIVEVAPGESVRRAGENCPSGAILRQAGEVVRPIDVGVAPAADIRRVVVRVARVRVLSLSRTAETDASIALVARLAEAAGAAVERVDAPVRRPKAIADALKIDGRDLIVVLGASLHPEAHQAALPIGFPPLIAAGIALRPGEGCGYGSVGAAPTITIPGSLDAALAATLALVLPCLDRLMQTAPRTSAISGPLTRKVSSAVGLTEIVLLRRAGLALEPLAVGDLTLTAMAQAEAWIAVPPASEGFAAGETVTALLL